MRRIAVFMGTRPEAIKMAPVVEALAETADLRPVVISTGQHREMLAQVVDLFGIHVDHELDVMRPNQSLASLSARLMTSIDALLTSDRPDLALVQGDTTTVLMAALACFYHRIPVGHIEAGLRTGNLWSPFPEEANRKLATSLMTLHFPPTPRSRENLRREHVPDQQILVTGNTVIDALRIEIQKQQQPDVARQINTELSQLIGEDWDSRPFVLITGHRRENFGGGFEAICTAIETLADEFTNFRFIYPVHLNPNVQGPVYGRLGGRENIRLIAPQQYRPFVALINACRLVLTDSGGVQEEAPGLGKPVLVMRDTTERPEGVDAGTVRLLGTSPSSITSAVRELLTDDAAYHAMSEAVNPYGDGHAAARIVGRIRSYLASV
jgi:UDP-N-acetylglucosamine 2-epimerase (non-hydrolysing)